MSYYQGDFYQGDFYQGDPGFGSFLRRAVGFGTSLIPGIGGVLGRVAGKAVSHLPMSVQKGTIRVARAAAAHPVLSAAAGAGTIAAAGAGTAVMMRGAPAAAGVAHMRMAAPGVAGMRGFHVSRKTGKIVRNRHMRVTNPKALRRALRRAHGFARLAMKTIHLVHPRKKARFGGFRKKRAR